LYGDIALLILNLCTRRFYLHDIYPFISRKGTRYQLGSWMDPKNPCGCYSRREKFLPSAGIRISDPPARSQPEYAMQIAAEM